MRFLRYKSKANLKAIADAESKILSFNVIHFLDVEVQTTNSPHRVLLHRSSVGGEQSFINTPFTRDPNAPIQCSLEGPTRQNSGIPGFHTANKRDTIQSSKSHIPYSVSLQI